MQNRFLKAKKDFEQKYKLRNTCTFFFFSWLLLTFFCLVTFFSELLESLLLLSVEGPLLDLLFFDLEFLDFFLWTEMWIKKYCLKGILMDLSLNPLSAKCDQDQFIFS